MDGALVSIAAVAGRVEWPLEPSSPFSGELSAVSGELFACRGFSLAASNELSPSAMSSSPQAGHKSN